MGWEPGPCQARAASRPPVSLNTVAYLLATLPAHAGQERFSWLKPRKLAVLLYVRPKPPHRKFLTTLFLLCGSCIQSTCLRGGVAIRMVTLHKHSGLLYTKANLVVKCANQQTESTQPATLAPETSSSWFFS